MIFGASVFNLLPKRYNGEYLVTSFGGSNITRFGFIVRNVVAGLKREDAEMALNVIKDMRLV